MVSIIKGIYFGTLVMRDASDDVPGCGDNQACYCGCHQDDEMWLELKEYCHIRRCNAGEDDGS